MVPHPVGGFCENLSDFVFSFLLQIHCTAGKEDIISDNAILKL